MSIVEKIAVFFSGSGARKDALQAEPILPISRIRKLRRAPETPGGPLALKDVFILVSFLNLASGYENMNDNLFKCGALSHSLHKNQAIM